MEDEKQDKYWQGKMSCRSKNMEGKREGALGRQRLHVNPSTVQSI
jgi:hypothetical protein